MVNAADSLRSDTSLLVDPNLEFSFLKFHWVFQQITSNCPPYPISSVRWSCLRNPGYTTDPKIIRLIQVTTRLG